MPASTVLVVEDDPTILQLLEVNSEVEGFDVMMPNTSGLELVAGVGAGASVTKPFEPFDLVDRIKQSARPLKLLEPVDHHPPADLESPS